jgi:Holliday junction resolvase
MRGGKGARQKGDRFEREIDEYAQERGLSSRRMPLSGAVEGFENDVEIMDWKFECKRSRNAISAKLEKAFQTCRKRGGIAVITRADRGDPMVYMDLGRFLDMMKQYKEVEHP